jgi:hypothetical protein
MRRGRGSLTVEVVALLIALLPLFFLLFDIILVFAGYQTNQTFCRDAARAASQVQPPANGLQTAGVVFDRASQICRDGQLNMVRGLLQGPFLESVEVRDYAPPGPFGGSYSGTVLVTTRMTVNIPASIPGLIPPQVQLRGVSSFPLTGSSESTIIVN